jgi:hypothetical protein
MGAWLPWQKLYKLSPTIRKNLECLEIFVIVGKSKFPCVLFFSRI